MTIITSTGGYKLAADATNIKALPGHIHLHLYSTLASAKNPDDDRTLLRLTLDSSGAIALAGALLETQNVRG